MLKFNKIKWHGTVELTQVNKWSDKMDAYDILRGFRPINSSSRPVDNSPTELLNKLRRENMLKDNEAIILKQRLDLLEKQRDYEINEHANLKKDKEFDFEGNNGTSVLDIVLEFDLGCFLAIAVRNILKSVDCNTSLDSDIQLLRDAVEAIEKQIDNLTDQL